MLMERITFILMLLFNILEVTKTDKAVILTLHTYTKSWNEAQAICEATGGNLFTEESSEKSAVFAQYQQTVPVWNNYRNTYIWIGLHSLQSGNSYNWNYGMDRCDEIQDGMFIKWKSAEPKFPTQNRCGAEKTGGNWWSRQCSEQYIFVCEREESTSCDFVFLTGIPKSSLSHLYHTETQHDISNIDDCTNICFLSTVESLNCWAVVYDATSEDCILYHTENPLLLSTESNLQPSSLVYRVKACYSSATHEFDDIIIPDSVSSLSNTPDVGCMDEASSPSSMTQQFSITTSSQSTSLLASFATTASTVGSETSDQNPTNLKASTNAASSASLVSPATTTLALPSTKLASFLHLTSLANVGHSTSSGTKPASVTSLIQTAGVLALTTPVSDTVPVTPSSSVSNPTSNLALANPASHASTETTPIPALTSSQSTGIAITTISSYLSPSRLSTNPKTLSTTEKSTLPATNSSSDQNCRCLRSDLINLYKPVSYYTDVANLSAEERFEKIIQRLQINTETLSATVRKKTSVVDMRLSSTSIGVSALVFMCLLFGLIIVSDMIMVVREIKRRLSEV